MNWDMFLVAKSYYNITLFLSFPLLVSVIMIQRKHHSACYSYQLCSYTAIIFSGTVYFFKWNGISFEYKYYHYHSDQQEYMTNFTMHGTVRNMVMLVRCPL